MDTKRCFRTAGQIYYGDVVEQEDGRCLRHGLGTQFVQAATVSGDTVIFGKYRGAWKEDQMSGSGAYRWSDGSSYEGLLLGGVPHGVGRFVWPEGSAYDGSWFNGELHGQGSFFSAYEGFARHGLFVRNEIQTHDGSRVDVIRQREAARAAHLRIGAPAPPIDGSLPTEEEARLPVAFCGSGDVQELLETVLRTAPFRVPLVVADDSCPARGGSHGSSAPLWCLEQGECGAIPETTVHLMHAAAEKRRKRDYPEIFRKAITESLLSYKPFCLVFGDEGLGNPQEEDSPLPAALCLDEFFDPSSLPLDLFDLQHFHTSGASEHFLPAHKQGMTPQRVESPPAQDGGDAAAVACPPMLAPPVLHLLRFAMVSLRRVPQGLNEDGVRALVLRRFAQHVPLQRASVIVVSA